MTWDYLDDRTRYAVVTMLAARDVLAGYAAQYPYCQRTAAAIKRLERACAELTQETQPPARAGYLAWLHGQADTASVQVDLSAFEDFIDTLDFDELEDGHGSA